MLAKRANADSSRVSTNSGTGSASARASGRFHCASQVRNEARPSTSPPLRCAFQATSGTVSPAKSAEATIKARVRTTPRRRASATQTAVEGSRK